MGRISGVLTLVIPIYVYMYYVLLEALCLRYSFEFFSGGFREMFLAAKAEGGTATAAASEFAVDKFGLAENGVMFGSSMLWLMRTKTSAPPSQM